MGLAVASASTQTSEMCIRDRLGGARRVRRTMAPLNDLALRVDELGRMQLAGVRRNLRMQHDLHEHVAQLLA